MAQRANTLARTETATETDDDIEISHVRLHSPLPADFPEHPDGCDYLGYLRYRLTAGPSDSVEADAILVMQPGALGGAYSFDRVARNTLRAAAPAGRTIEWWSLARRGEGGSDNTGIDAAREAGDPDIAFGYYFGDREIDGRRFEGFKSSAEVPYLAEMGLAQAVRDEHEVLIRELPDAHVRRSKVFLGGHSMGGLVTAAIGAWDFDGVPGHEHCAGFIALDTLIVTDPLGLRTNPLLSGLGHPIADTIHRTLVGLIRRGVLPRYAFLPTVDPEGMTMLKLLGLLAYFKGSEETSYSRVLPDSVNKRGRPFLQSRTFRQYLTGRSALPDTRLTGEAMLGSILGSGVSSHVMRVTMGSLAGGPIARRSFPAPAWAWRLPVVNKALTAAFGSRPLVTAKDPDTLYRWHSKVGPGQPADLTDWARQIMGGPLGYVEIYFPTRIGIDMFLMLTGSRDGELSAIRHTKDVNRKPLLTVAQDLPHQLKRIPFVDSETVIVPGYSHVDIITGAAREDGPPEPVSHAITAFLAEHTQSKITAPAWSRRRARIAAS